MCLHINILSKDWNYSETKSGDSKTEDIRHPAGRILGQNIGKIFREIAVLDLSQNGWHEQREIG